MNFREGVYPLDLLRGSTGGLCSMFRRRSMSQRNITKRYCQFECTNNNQLTLPTHNSNNIHQTLTGGKICMFKEKVQTRHIACSMIRCTADTKPLEEWPMLQKAATAYVYQLCPVVSNRGLGSHPQPEVIQKSPPVSSTAGVLQVAATYRIVYEPAILVASIMPVHLLNLRLEPQDSYCHRRTEGIQNQEDVGR